MNPFLSLVSPHPRYTPATDCSLQFPPNYYSFLSISLAHSVSFALCFPPFSLPYGRDQVRIHLQAVADLPLGLVLVELAQNSRARILKDAIPRNGPTTMRALMRALGRRARLRDW